MDELIKEEIKRRKALFALLTKDNKAVGIQPTKLHELAIYKGAAGIWTNKSITSKITASNQAIAVSVLHTGKHYQEDFDESGIFYHFPNTSRIGNTDNNEIQALQSCYELSIPIFTIVANKNNSKLRDVYLGKITLIDYNSKVVLIEFNKHSDQFNQIKEPYTEFLPIATQKSIEVSISKKLNRTDKFGDGFI